MNTLRLSDFHKNIQKHFSNLDNLQKSELPIGHISTYADGSKHQKISNNEWKEITKPKRDDKEEDRITSVNRLSTDEEQGRARGGRRAVELTHAAGRGATAGKEPSEADQVESVLEYAKKKGWLLDVDEIRKNNEYLDGGSEARVYLKNDGKTVLKIIDYHIFSSTPLQFLDDRIALHNYLFPETKLVIEGVVKEDDKLNFVVSQRFIRSASSTIVGPPLSDIVEELEKRGFVQDEDAFVSEDYVAFDMHRGNWVRGANGELYCIDSVIVLNTEDEGYGGERKYNP